MTTVIERQVPDHLVDMMATDTNLPDHFHDRAERWSEDSVVLMANCVRYANGFSGGPSLQAAINARRDILTHWSLSERLRKLYLYDVMCMTAVLNKEHERS